MRITSSPTPNYAAVKAELVNQQGCGFAGHVRAGVIFLPLGSATITILIILLQLCKILCFLGGAVISRSGAPIPDPMMMMWGFVLRFRADNPDPSRGREGHGKGGGGKYGGIRQSPAQGRNGGRVFFSRVNFSADCCFISCE